MVEFLPAVGGAGIDAEVSKTIQRILTKQGLKFKMATKVMSAENSADGTIKVNVESVSQTGRWISIVSPPTPTMVHQNWRYGH